MVFNQDFLAMLQVMYQCFRPSGNALTIIRDRGHIKKNATIDALHVLQGFLKTRNVEPFFTVRLQSYKSCKAPTCERTMVDYSCPYLAVNVNNK